MRLVSKKRLIKHVPVETNERNNRRTVFLMLSATRIYLEDYYVEQFKRQTRPLIRESAPYQQTCNCLTVMKI
jgi:hypothetical protein